MDKSQSEQSQQHTDKKTVTQPIDNPFNKIGEAGLKANLPQSYSLEDPPEYRIQGISAIPIYRDTNK